MNSDLIVLHIQFFCVAVLLIIYLTYQSNSQFVIQSRYFKALIRTLFVLSLANIVFRLAPKDSTIIPSLFDVVKVMLLLRTAALWFLFIYHKTDNHSYAIRKWTLLFASPTFMVLVYAVIDFCNNKNSSDPNPALWALSCAAGIIYMISASVVAYNKSKKCRNIFNCYAYRYLAAIVALPIIGCGLQFIDLRMAILEPILTLAVLHIYIMSLKQMIPYDLQTGVNNKQRLMGYLEEVTQHLDSSKRLFFIQFGICDFNKIKKERGINTAALILKDTAKFLQKQCNNSNLFLARNGKETFAIVMQDTSIANIEKFCSELVQSFEKDRVQKHAATPVTLNIYWSEYGESSTNDIRQFTNPKNFNCYK